MPSHDEPGDITTGLKPKRDRGKRGKSPARAARRLDKNGRPIPPQLLEHVTKPGEVRNPNGVNQYSYRQKFDESIGKLLQGEITEDELKTLTQAFPPNFKDVIRRTFGKELPTRGELLALREIWWTMQGHEPSTGRALARIWPATLKLENAAGEEVPIPKPLSDKLEKELRKLGESYARERGTREPGPVVETTAVEVSSDDSQS